MIKVSARPDDIKADSSQNISIFFFPIQDYRVASSFGAHAERDRGWRLHDRGIMGNPDVIFPACRVVVFLDGCFWHDCRLCRRKMPRHNKIYWQTKISYNINRARRVNASLKRSGFHVIRIWEHELKRKSFLLPKSLQTALYSASLNHHAAST